MRIVHRFTEPMGLPRSSGVVPPCRGRRERAHAGHLRGRRTSTNCYLATVEENQTVVACALRTPPHSALLTASGSPGPRLAGGRSRRQICMPPRCRRSRARRRRLRRAVGRAHGSGRGAGGAHARVRGHRVVRPPMPTGTFRAATAADLPTWPGGRRRSSPRRASTTRPMRVMSRVNGYAGAASSSGRMRGRCRWRPGRAHRANGARQLRLHLSRAPRTGVRLCVRRVPRSAASRRGAHVMLHLHRPRQSDVEQIYLAIGYRPVADVAEYRLGAG